MASSVIILAGSTQEPDPESALTALVINTYGKTE
jgi:hypothetical protein